MTPFPSLTSTPLSESRDTLARNYLSLFSNYLSSPPNAPPPPALITLLSSPRVKLLDLSTLDPTTGTSILHEAAKRKDLRMVELLVRAGADVFVRDRRGRAVGEGEKGYTKADDQVKVFLRQCAYTTFLFIHVADVILSY